MTKAGNDKRWSTAVKRLRARLRTEKTRRLATQEALVSIIRELATSIQGQLEIIEEEWPETPEPGKKPNGKSN